MSAGRYEDYWAAHAPSPLSDPLTRRRRDFLWARVGRVDSGQISLLDCGAGDGGLVEDARARGYRAVGLEVSAAAIERAEQTRPGLDLRRHSVEDLPWPVEAASWDAVVSFEVIEHLVEPRALLEGAQAALVPGGGLFISTPFHGIAKNLAVAAFRFDAHFAVEGDHIRFFTDRALRRLLESGGFAIVEIVHLGRVRPLWANTLVHARKR